jgi:hypothetical protein
MEEEMRQASQLKSYQEAKGDGRGKKNLDLHQEADYDAVFDKGMRCPWIP